MPPNDTTAMESFPIPLPPAASASRQRPFSVKDFAYTPIWNIFLIVCGSALFAFGAKAVVFAHGFITGGLFGASLLINYLTDLLSPGPWYLLLNLPLIAVAWFFISRRFFVLQPAVHCHRGRVLRVHPFRSGHQPADLCSPGRRCDLRGAARESSCARWARAAGWM